MEAPTDGQMDEDVAVQTNSQVPGTTAAAEALAVQQELRDLTRLKKKNYPWSKKKV